MLRISKSQDEKCEECGHGLHAAHTPFGCTEVVETRFYFSRRGLFTRWSQKDHGYVTKDGVYQSHRYLHQICLCQVKWQPLVGSIPNVEV